MLKRTWHECDQLLEGHNSDVTGEGLELEEELSGAVDNRQS